MGHLYATVTGQRRGKFAGTTVPGVGGNQIECLEFRRIDGFGDPGTGAAKGQRMHGVLEITIPASPTVPTLYNALSTNEAIAEAEFRFLPERGGAAATIVTIKNGLIVKITQKSGGSSSGGLIQGPRMDFSPTSYQIHLVYEGITISRRKVDPQTPYWLHS